MNTVWIVEAIEVTDNWCNDASLCSVHASEKGAKEAQARYEAKSDANRRKAISHFRAYGNDNQLVPPRVQYVTTEVTLEN